MPETRGVVHVRQTRGTEQMPWRDVYFVPNERLEDVFLWFGVSMSFPWLPPLRGEFWGHQVGRARGEELRQLQNYTVVIPLRTGRGPRVTGLAPDRGIVRADERSRTPESVCKRRAEYVAAAGVALHFAPGPEGITSLCGCCDFVADHLMGLCTPGLEKCARGVAVPEGPLVSLRTHPTRRRRSRPSPLTEE